MGDSFKLVLTKGTRYVDRSGQNASDYWVHDIDAGEYALQWTTIDYRPTTRDKAYYAVIVLTSTQVEYGGVNRVFSASSSFRDTKAKRSTVSVTLYRYEVEAGMKIHGGTLVEGVSLNKTRIDFASTKAGWCARAEADHRIGKQLIDAKRLPAGGRVSLDHVDRGPQRHKAIRGDRGYWEISLTGDTYCDCLMHRTRRSRGYTKWRLRKAHAAA